jgi:hypothetical protein
MTIRAIALIAASLGACGAENTPDGTVIATTGTVERTELEGGAWLIAADSGTLYEPRNLPEAFMVIGARVEVRLIERRNIGGVPGPGVAADILEITEASCEGVVCGVPSPPVTLHVSGDGASSAVEGVTLTNLSVPASPPGSGGLTFGCHPGAAGATCFVDAIAPGTYTFDVTAPGYQTAHVTVGVPVRQHVLGVCCESPWEPQTVEVQLVPA